MWLLTALKNSILPEEAKPFTILTGPFKGIAMELPLRCNTQLYVGLLEREVSPWLARLSEGIAAAVDIGVANGEYTLFFLTKTSEPGIRIRTPVGLSPGTESQS